MYYSNKGLFVTTNFKKTWVIQGSPTSTISTNTNFRAIGIKLVLAELLPDCYVVHTSTNLAKYDFFQIPNRTKRGVFCCIVAWI